MNPVISILIALLITPWLALPSLAVTTVTCANYSVGKYFMKEGKKYLVVGDDSSAAPIRKNILPLWNDTHLCTTHVTDMQALYNKSWMYMDVNDDLTDWDTSNVTNMDMMFVDQSDFNQDISGWNTSKVTNMNEMFYSDTVFSQNLSGWDVSSVSHHNLFSTLSGLKQEQLPHWESGF